MFCPYVRDTYTRIVKIHYDEGLQQEDGSIIHEKYTNAECKKEECGVWSDGRCRYDGQ